MYGHYAILASEPALLRLDVAHAVYSVNDLDRHHHHPRCEKVCFDPELIPSSYLDFSNAPAV